MGNIVIVVVIWEPNTELHANIDIFSYNIEDIMVTGQNEKNKQWTIMGDCKCESSSFLSHGLIPVISKTTRIITSSATVVIDHMYSNLINLLYHSGIIFDDLTDHYGRFCIYERNSKHSSQTSPKHQSFNTEKYDTILEYVKGY